MNYDTLYVSYMLPNDCTKDLEPKDYLRVAINSMAAALADEIIKSKIGDIYEDYSIEHNARFYTMLIRIVKNETNQT